MTTTSEKSAETKRRHKAANRAQEILSKAELAERDRLDAARNAAHALVAERELEAAKLLQDARDAAVKLGLNAERIPLICLDVKKMSLDVTAMQGNVGNIMKDVAGLLKSSEIRDVKLAIIGVDSAWVKRVTTAAIVLLVPIFGWLALSTIKDGNQLAAVAATLEAIKNK